MTNAVEADSLVSVGPLQMRVLHFAAGSMFATIVLLGILFLFDPPLNYDDFVRILQQVVPVLVGFLLAGVSYAASDRRAGSIESHRYNILNLVLLASFCLYWLGTIVLTILFLYSHSGYAPVGRGMDKETFFTTLTIFLSVVTGAAGAISTRLFIEEYKAGVRNGDNP